MTELTLEQLRFARAIGATDKTVPPSDGKNTFYRNVRENSYEYFSNKTGAWEKSKGKPIFNTSPINFAPLEEAEQTGQHVDMVNKPPHYQTDNGIECIDAIRAALGLDGFIAYCRGNAIKYGWRAGKKDETAQDLRKAAWYLERAAQEMGK